MHSQCNYARKTPILTQMKSGEAFETIMQNNWLGAKVANLRTWAQLKTKYRFCMGITDWPSRATNFNTNFSCLVLWERKSINVSWELPVKIAAP